MVLMRSPLDRYSNQAEALPVFLMLVPITLFLAVGSARGDYHLKDCFLGVCPSLV